MRILLSGGGTAGHVNPAIAIARYVKSRQPHAVILFVGTPNGMERELVQKAGFTFASVQVSGFRRSLSLKGVAHNLRAVKQVVLSHFTATKLIEKFAPDIVIGTGGYVSGPVVRAATKLGIKTMIHEQNALPGITNKLLAKKVDCVMVAVEAAKVRFHSAKHLAVVGNPVREEIVLTSKQDARNKLQIGDQICVLSFGGSLGANIINQAAADLLFWNQSHQKIFHIHGYGRLGNEYFPTQLAKRGLSLSQLQEQTSHALIKEYLDEMALYLAAADLVICRSGAVTLSELACCGKASILIPSPYVSENHQYHNAMVFKKENAAEVVVEQHYQKDAFLEMIERLVSDPKELQQLGTNAAKLAVFDTTQRIYYLIQTLLK